MANISSDRSDSSIQYKSIPTKNNENNICVVTVTFNSEKYLEMFFSAMNKQKVSGTLIIVDSNSKDNTIGFIENNKNRIMNWECILLKQNDNVGIAAGNNIGIEKAMDIGAEVIVLINNDIDMKEDTLDKLVKNTVEKNCVSVPLIYYGEPNDKIWYSGGGFSWLKGMNFHSELTPKSKVIDVDYAPTCCMVLKPDFIRKVGMMDEEYFMYFDDTDFCARLLKNNIKIEVITDSVLYHYVGSSTGGEGSPLSLYFASRNRVKFILKNSPKLYIIISLGYFFTTRLIKLSILLLKDRKKAWYLLISLLDVLNNNYGKGRFVK